MKSSALSALGRRSTEPPISWLMKLTLDHPKLISLAAGFTDNASLPVAEARAVLDEILRTPRSGRPALQYGSTAGDPQLRELTARRLHALDGGPSILPDRTLITHGSQQLLYMLTEALCDEGDLVLVEDPTYFVFLGILQSRGIRAHGITLREDGLDVAQLERTLERLKRTGELPRLKMLYLVSYFQNPSGITTTLAKKRAALDLLRRYERAAGHPLYLLEDAAYRELRFDGGDVPSALTLPHGPERVLYAGTYSKPFATGIRVGFGVLPEPVLTTVRRIKGNHDFGTAHLLQKILARALASGAYARHLAELRSRYQKKSRVMAAAVREHFPAQVEWAEPRGGLYLWARTPRAVKTGPKSKFFRQALQRDVLYVPGGLCYAADPARRKPDHEMRLSFGNASEDEMREGIRRLGALLRAALTDR